MQSIGGGGRANDPVHIPRTRRAGRFRAAGVATPAVTSDTVSLATMVSTASPRGFDPCRRTVDDGVIPRGFH